MTFTSTATVFSSFRYIVWGHHPRGGQHRWKRHRQGRYCTRCTAMDMVLA